MVPHLVHTNTFLGFKTMENAAIPVFNLSLITAPSIGTPAGLSW
jgi:hypothetical protein